MKYNVELSYVCHQAAKPWWSKTEIKGFKTRITKKNQIEMDVIRRKKNELATIKINKEKKTFGIATIVATFATKPRITFD